MARILALAALAPLAAATDAHGCPGFNRTMEDWVHSPALKAQSDARLGKAVTPPTYIVDLDLDPKDRWTEIGALYKNQSYLIIDYFETFLPEALLKA